MFQVQRVHYLWVLVWVWCWVHPVSDNLTAPFSNSCWVNSMYGSSHSCTSHMTLTWERWPTIITSPSFGWFSLNWSYYRSIWPQYLIFFLHQSLYSGSANHIIATPDIDILRDSKSSTSSKSISTGWPIPASDARSFWMNAQMRMGGSNKHGSIYKTIYIYHSYLIFPNFWKICEPRCEYIYKVNRGNSEYPVIPNTSLTPLSRLKSQRGIDLRLLMRVDLHVYFV